MLPLEGKPTGEAIQATIAADHRTGIVSPCVTHLLIGPIADRPDSLVDMIRDWVPVLQDDSHMLCVGLDR